jgi:hypothetical protein
MAAGQTLAPLRFVPFVILDRNKRNELTQMDYLGGAPRPKDLTAQTPPVLTFEPFALRVRARSLGAASVVLWIRWRRSEDGKNGISEEQILRALRQAGSGTRVNPGRLAIVVSITDAANSIKTLTGSPDLKATVESFNGTVANLNRGEGHIVMGVS